MNVCMKSVLLQAFELHHRLYGFILRGAHSCLITTLINFELYPTKIMKLKYAHPLQVCQGKC